MQSFEDRLREVDALVPESGVRLDHLADYELRLVADLCKHFDLPLGSLVRRAEAIRLAGGQGTLADCLREAAQHLVAR